MGGAGGGGDRVGGGVGVSVLGLPVVLVVCAAVSACLEQVGGVVRMW